FRGGLTRLFDFGHLAEMLPKFQFPEDAIHLQNDSVTEDFADQSREADGFERLDSMQGDASSLGAIPQPSIQNIALRRGANKVDEGFEVFLNRYGDRLGGGHGGASPVRDDDMQGLSAGRDGSGHAP